jgi:hypothetical protein
MKKAEFRQPARPLSTVLNINFNRVYNNAHGESLRRFPGVTCLQVNRDN